MYRGPLSDLVLAFGAGLELIKIEGLLEQGLFDKTETALDALRAASGIRDETFAATHRLGALQFYLEAHMHLPSHMRMKGWLICML